MPRNLFRRLETVFPVVTPNMVNHLEEIIDWFWRDNAKAKVMDSDGQYHPVATDAETEIFDCQQAFIEEAGRRRKAKLVT
jgi:polyphosphate kinase